MFASGAARKRFPEQFRYGRTDMETVSRGGQVFLELSYSVFRPLSIFLAAMGCVAVLLIVASSLLSLWTVQFLMLHQRIFLTLMVLVVFGCLLFGAIRRIALKPICRGRIDMTGVTAYETHYPWEQINRLDCVWIPFVGHQLIARLRSQKRMRPLVYVPTRSLAPAEMVELSDRLTEFLSTSHPHVRVELG